MEDFYGFGFRVHLEIVIYRGTGVCDVRRQMHQRDSGGRIRREWRKNAVICALVAAALWLSWNSEAAERVADDFPYPLSSYPQTASESFWETLLGRAQADPINLFATAIFLLAITHTFLAPTFMRLAHRYEREHRERLRGRGEPRPDAKEEVSFKAEMFHLFGEIEAIFGIWVVPLLIVITGFKGWNSAVDYMEHDLNFTEPLFVVVVMSIAGSRPVLKFAERMMSIVAALGKGSASAWWISILTVGPLLGSFITEPAAMTICALLLAQKFYERKPSVRLAYGTLGLLFVNVSVGGTLTHFAAPPVLMVAGKWGWGMGHMLTEFGWKAALGIVAANAVYFFYFVGELRRLGPAQPPLDVAIAQREGKAEEPVPLWITLVHLLFLGWVVMNNHYPVLFVGGFLFYLAFTQATQHRQFDFSLRGPLLVGFFLAGLVVHGGLQGWWIEPVLTRFTEVPLFIGAMTLTAFNDNAAITYLASLVPGFSEGLKYAVVAGAVAGGGLTVIANAPNPAGQSILAGYFPDGVSPLRLCAGALIPTAIMAAFFLVFR